MNFPFLTGERISSDGRGGMLRQDMEKEGSLSQEVGEQVVLMSQICLSTHIFALSWEMGTIQYRELQNHCCGPTSSRALRTRLDPLVFK